MAFEDDLVDLVLRSFPSNISCLPAQAAHHALTKMLATMLSTTSTVIRERVSENHSENVSRFGERSKDMIAEVLLNIPNLIVPLVGRTFAE